MGKSVVATLIGRLIQQGAYELEQKAPIPEWQAPGDPRSAASPTSCTCYPDHLYLYTGGVDSYHYAATRPQQWPPNTVGRYRNTDPVLASYLVRLAVTKRGLDYLSFPQRALFDKLGIRTMVLETDPYGNFLTQGYELASARDWARLGNLYPRLASRPPPNLRRLLLDQRRRRDARPARGLLHVRRRRPDDLDHPVPRPSRGPPRPLQGQHPG